MILRESTACINANATHEHGQDVHDQPVIDICLYPDDRLTVTNKSSQLIANNRAIGQPGRPLWLGRKNIGQSHHQSQATILGRSYNAFNLDT